MTNKRNVYHTRCLAAVAICLTLLGSGCSPGGPEIAGVRGKVTMDGQPLPNAMVVFIPAAGGRPAGASTDQNGEYELNFSGGRKGTIPGLNRIKISTLSDPSEDADGNPIPASPETVPAKYNSQTELEFTVEADKLNEANFDLSSEGKILDNSDYGDE